jgi:hypothetical protein
VQAGVIRTAAWYSRAAQKFLSQVNGGAMNPVRAYPPGFIQSVERHRRNDATRAANAEGAARLPPTTG